MFTRRAKIRGVALVVLATLAVLGLQPPEHLHPSLVGRSVVVHRHAITMLAPQAASSIDHDDPRDLDDHRDVQILKTIFESTPRFAPDSLIVLQTTAVFSPSWCIVGHIDLLYEWTCHD